MNHNTTCQGENEMRNIKEKSYFNMDIVHKIKNCPSLGHGKAIAIAAIKESTAQTRNIKKGILVVHMMRKSYGLSLNGKKRIIKWGKIIKVEESQFDEKTSRLKASWSFFNESGEDLKDIGRINFDNRLYSFNELKDIVISAGWEYREGYSNLVLDPICNNSKYFVVIATK